MTKAEYDYFLSFTEEKSKSIFKNVSCNLLQIEDFFFNAFAKQPENLHKQIVAEIYHEYYRQVGVIQQKNGKNTFDKKCNCCKKTKDSSLFRQRFSNKYQLFYLNHICRECAYEKYHSDNGKKKRHLNRGKTALSKRIYYEANKEKIIAYSKIWRQNNLDKNRISQKKYRDKNKEKHKELKKKWRYKNKDKIKEYGKMYYLRKNVA